MAYRELFIPRVEDDQTDRALRALLSMVQSLAEQVLGASDGPYESSQNVLIDELDPEPNVTVDGRLSNNYKITLDQNVTIADPFGVVEGQIINIAIQQDSTGSRTAAWGSAWLFPGGSPTLSTAGDAKDLVSGIVISETKGTATEVWCSIAKAMA